MSYNVAQLADLLLGYIDAEPGLKLAEVSKRLGACRQTLEGALRARTGKSFRQLRSELVATRARVQLGENASHLIKQVAYDLGYKSPQAFSRFVREVYGYSPTELRKRSPVQPQARGSAKRSAATRS